MTKASKQEEDLKKKEKAMHDAWEEEAKVKANRLADALNAEQAVQNQEAGGVAAISDDEFLLAGGAEKLTDMAKKNGTKAALLVGKTVLRSRNLHNELIAKDQLLKKTITNVQSLQAEVYAKDVELEDARQALLHAAAVQVPSATSQEAKAARIALEDADGKLDAQERELNATKAELSASKSTTAIEEEEMTVLKDDHTELGKQVKKLGDALISEHKQNKKTNKELVALKSNMQTLEKSNKELAQRNAVFEKAANAAKAKADAENAAKAAVAKQAADQEAAAQKAATEQQKAEQAQAKLQQAHPVKRSGDGDDDDDSDSDSDDTPDEATVPWDKIRTAAQR